jgi:hypothetical protein
MPMVLAVFTRNHLPEDEPSGSKHVEGNIKIKISV